MKSRKPSIPYIIWMAIFTMIPMIIQLRGFELWISKSCICKVVKEGLEKAATLNWSISVKYSFALGTIFFSNVESWADSLYQISRLSFSVGSLFTNEYKRWVSSPRKAFQGRMALISFVVRLSFSCTHILPLSILPPHARPLSRT